MANRYHSLQRRTYRATRSFLRLWRARAGIRLFQGKVKSRRIKIVTNVQIASVAGISRVMSSFAEYVTTSSDVDIHLVSIGVTPPGDFSANAWHEIFDQKTRLATLLYAYELPNFGDILEQSKHLADIEKHYALLIQVFTEKLREEKPDVVLLNGTFIVPWCLLMAARSLHIPMVHYYHGSLVKETEHWESEKAKKHILAIEQSFNRSGMYYIFPSNLVKNFVEKYIFMRTVYHSRALVVPNPIPEEFFASHKKTRQRGVGFVGRWTRIKNIAFVTRFADANKRQRPNFDVYVVTDTASKQRAKKVVHRDVTFHPPYESILGMARFYASMRAIICPSYFETYGNVAQEAIASGTAALVSQNMGVSEVYERVGLSRLIVDFSDLRQIFKTLQNKKLLAISRTERQALYEEASAPVVHKKLLEFIRRCV